MRKIYILSHKARYDSSGRPIRAYESETDAQAMLELLAGIVRGELEIVPVDLEAASKPGFDMRGGAPMPPIIMQGPVGRADLP